MQETSGLTSNALHVAASNGDTDRVLSLWSAGADLNARDGLSNQTPLIAAAEAGQFEAAQALLEAGAKVDAADIWGRTALIWAAGYGSRPVKPAEGLAVVRLLLEHGGDASHIAEAPDTPLIAAARAGSASAVRLFLEYGAAVNARDVHEETALFYAAEEGRTEVVSLLLDWGAEVNLVDCFGDTPLLNAASNEHEETLRLLLKRGADPDVPNRIGHTAITQALAFERIHILAILLEGGANPDLRFGDQTYLMMALYDERAVRLLLAYGADITLRDNHGKTALQQALEDCAHSAVPLLEAAEAKLRIDKENRARKT